MFKLSLGSAKVFKRSVDCLRDVVYEVSIRLDSNGMMAYVFASGCSISAIYHPNESFFLGPRGNYEFGLSANTLSKLLRGVRSTQEVEIEMSDLNEVEVSVIDSDTISRYTLSTLDVSPPPLQFRQIDAVAEAILATQHLRTLFRDLRLAGDEVSVEITDGALIFYGATDNTTAEICTKNVQLSGTDGPHGTYNLGIIQHFLKSNHLSSSITLRFGASLEIMLESEIVRLSLVLDRV